MADHLTSLPENRLVEYGIDAVERARALHHLATADPEVDGELSGEEHAAKYGLGQPPVKRAGRHEAIETTAAPRASDTK